MPQSSAGLFKLLIARGGLTAGSVVEAVEFRDLGPITLSKGLVDVVLKDESVLQLVDPSRHLRRVRRRKSGPGMARS